MARILRYFGRQVNQFAVAKVADFGIVDQPKVAARREQWTKPAFGQAGRQKVSFLRKKRRKFPGVVGRGLQKAEHRMLGWSGRREGRKLVNVSQGMGEAGGTQNGTQLPARNVVGFAKTEEPQAALAQVLVVVRTF